MASKRILWILWLVLFTWKWNYLNCFEIQKGDSVNEVDCQYDLVSGGRICDCGFQNVVRTPSFHSFFKSKPIFQRKKRLPRNFR